MFVYKKLEVWQMDKDLAVDVYKITSSFPDEEKFSLVNQLNRAAISVPSNIAEGCSRSSMKEQAHFSEIVYGSLMEVACQLEISKDLGYISNDSWNDLCRKMEDLAAKLSYYRNSQLKRAGLKG